MLRRPQGGWVCRVCRCRMPLPPHSIFQQSKRDFKRLRIRRFQRRPKVLTVLDSPALALDAPARADCLDELVRAGSGCPGGAGFLDELAGAGFLWHRCLAPLQSTVLADVAGPRRVVARGAAQFVCAAVYAVADERRT
jgi:hypothetical protein